MAERRRVTIKDVARETGLAVSTVSNALAGKPLVRPETREQVVEAARRLGYRASLVARSLRAQRSYAIGVLIEDVANPSAAAFVRGVEDLVDRAGCTLLLANTDGDVDRQVAAMQVLLDRGVDGLVMISQHLADERIREMLAGGIPTVLVQRRDPELDFDYVGADNSDGIREALRYVKGLGHHRIGYLTGPLVSSSARERLRTFRDGVAELGLDASEELVCHGRYSLDAGLEAAGYFSGMRQRPTCIFASNDMSAIGLIQGLGERGLDVPADVSIVGLDDIELARIKAIDLTTIRLEKREIGAEAARLLLRRVDRPDAPARTVILPTRLIVRGTTSPCATR
ncbi:LacI family DNA-binding transcriptional regulator [Salinarimonas sp. NSM]|uniref:LacI family DNA-binding transcriptional regulator n=1 Tax=Salinarimonas sp. NSM TaxID=3458003 RepID=UPI004035585B